ncbi:MAG: hypothetical protein U0V64_09085 [Cyclobacteriaceae bacterium]
MVRAILMVGLVLMLVACTQRLICPAYQSSFIYDKETLRKKFSYFKEDSTPKVLTASKTKYLIAVPESYRKKYRRLQTIEMKPVYPVIPDSLKQDSGEFLNAERADNDSTAAQRRGIDPTDSAYAITKAKEKFNVDQDNYMWYFRDVLVLPDVRAAMDARKKDDTRSGATPGKRGNVKARKSDAPAVPSDSSAVEKPRRSLNPFKRKDKKTDKKESTDKKTTEKEDDGF